MCDIYIYIYMYMYIYREREITCAQGPRIATCRTGRRRAAPATTPLGRRRAATTAVAAQGEPLV